MKSDCLAILYLQKTPDARTMCSSYFSKTKYFLDIIKRNKKAHSHDLKPRFQDFRQMIISIYIGTDQRRCRSVCLTGVVNFGIHGWNRSARRQGQRCSTYNLGRSHPSGMYACSRSSAFKRTYKPNTKTDRKRCT